MFSVSLPIEKRVCMPMLKLDGRDASSGVLGAVTIGKYCPRHLSIPILAVEELQVSGGDTCV